MGLPRSTTHRILSELHAQGLILRLARGRYDIGLGLAEAVSAASFNGQLAQVSREPLARLVKRSGLTAHLGVFENDMVTYLVKAPSNEGAVSFTRENGQLEAYCSGIGKILLAHLPAPLSAAYLAGGPFIALTERTVTDPARLAVILDRARTDDYAMDEGEIADGLRCLAVPVRTPSGRVVAAISVSMIGEAQIGVTDADLLGKMGDCATTIGESFGRA